MNAPASVLILGHGFLGQALAARLRARGMLLQAIQRRPPAEALPYPVYALDVEKDALPAACWDCAAWVILLPPSALRDYAACLQYWAHKAAAAGVKHWVLASSISVYGSRARLCDEYSAPEPENASARAVLAAEQALWHSPLPCLDVLRLGGLYADERHPLRSLLQRKKLSRGGEAVNMVHRDGAVEALEGALMRPQRRQLRNVVEAEHPSRRDFYRREALRLGWPMPDFADANADTAPGKIVINAIGQ